MLLGCFPRLCPQVISTAISQNDELWCGERGPDGRSLSSSMKLK